MVRSPRRERSVTLRSDRPINRWISWVRPPGRPRLTSREDRSVVEAGSIEYSPVTHPPPVPLSQRGASSETLAATSTRVLPIENSTEPAAHSWKPSCQLTGRSSSGDLPSGRVTAQPSRLDLQGRAVLRELDGTVERRRRLDQRDGGIEGRQDVCEHQSLRAGLSG